MIVKNEFWLDDGFGCIATGTLQAMMELAEGMFTCKVIDSKTCDIVFMRRGGETYIRDGRNKHERDTK